MSTKTSTAVVMATMRRYRDWKGKYPVAHGFVVAENDEGAGMSKIAGDMIRACHEHAKTTGSGRRKNFDAQRRLTSPPPERRSGSCARKCCKMK